MDLSNAPRRSRIARIIFLAVLGLALVGLTQCRQVADSLTGLDLGHGRLDGKSACVQACNDQFQSGQKAEQDTHKNAVQACGNDAACLSAEEARHEAAMDALSAAKSTCKGACYNEGGGGTGS